MKGKMDIHINPKKRITVHKGGAGSGHHGHPGLSGVWGGSRSSGADKGGAGGGKPSKKKSAYKLPIRTLNRRVGEDIFRDLGGSRGHSSDSKLYDAYDDHGIKKGYYEVGIRDWGRWENPYDAADEQDYDWQVMTDESKAAMNKKVEGYRKKYPEYNIEWNTGEKNWLYVNVKPKFAKKE